MQIELTFIPFEDENGYLSYSPTTKDGRRNFLLRGIAILEKSLIANSGLYRYRREDKPSRDKSVWVHSNSIAIYNSFDECKAALTKEIENAVNEFVRF